MRSSGSGCRILEGLLEATFGSFSRQGSVEGSADLALQNHSLAFLSRLLQVAPSALQTLRRCNAWDRVFGQDMFFHSPEPILRSDNSSAAKLLGGSEATDASQTSTEDIEEQIKIRCEVNEHNCSVAVRMYLSSSRNKDTGEILDLCISLF